MSYTVFHTHREPNRYYTVSVDAFKRLASEGLRVTWEKTVATPETIAHCANSQKNARKQAQNTAAELRKSQEEAVKCLSGFIWFGVSDPVFIRRGDIALPLEEPPANIGVPSIKPIPGSLWENPDAPDNFTFKKWSPDKSQWLPSNIQQNGNGKQCITIGRDTYCNWIKQ